MEKGESLRMLNRGVLKGIAAAAMLIDHIGWRFFPFSSPTAQLFHVIGRVTLPVMCFFLAEGYAHTRSKKKYVLRLFLFALLSQVPYALFKGNSWDALDLNVIFTLLFCFVSVLYYDRIENNMLRWAAILGCIMATLWCDWPVTAVLFTLVFWVCREEEEKRTAAFCTVAAFYFCFTLFEAFSAGIGFIPSLLSSLYTLGVFLALPLILFYSGRKGRFLEGRTGRWVYYIFYPAHLLALSLL